MKTRTCNVALDHARIDLSYDGILFRGAALHGSGGIMGDASKDGWMDIAVRFRALASTKLMARVYTICTASKQEFFDAPAAKCKLLAVYAPEYAP